MPPNHKSQSRNRQQTPKRGFKLFDKIHFDQVIQALRIAQESLPKELFWAIGTSISKDGKITLELFINEDLKPLIKKISLGSPNRTSFNLKNFWASGGSENLKNKLLMPLGEFWEQLKQDLNNKNNPERATYLLKVSALFLSSLLSIQSSLQITQASRLRRFSTLKTKKMPIVPSLALVLAAKLLSRFIKESLNHIPEHSSDYELAEFVIANLEIVAFGGSLGSLSKPVFLDSPTDDDALKLIKILFKPFLDQSSAEAASKANLITPGSSNLT